MTSLVLARKWRPHNFDTVTGQTHVIQTLTHALSSQRLHHAYLFTGTRGVGKTSIARILAKALSCEIGITANPCGKCLNCQEVDAGRFVDLIEIDAASRSKVEDTREILDNILYAPVRGRFKIYLIDEIHMLSGHSFNALLKTLEEPPEHVKFLLATTDPKKLPITVLSRCLQFHLKNMLPHEIVQHLAEILQKENIAYEASALPWIAQAADGSLRDALSLLDQAIAHGQNDLKEKNVREMLGYIEIHHITGLVEALITKNNQAILSISANLQHQGADCFYVLRELQSLFHQMAIAQCVPEYQSEHTSMLTASKLATQISPEDLQLFYQIALKGGQDLSLAPTPWIAFEMTLLRMLVFQPVLVGTPPPLPNLPPLGGKEQIGDNLLSQNTIIKSQKSPSVEQSIRMAPPLAKGGAGGIFHEKTHQTSVNTSTENIQWETLLPLLKLTGMANTIAQHCTLDTSGLLSDNQATLNIPAKHSALFTTSIKQQIENALSHYFSKTPDYTSKNILISFQVAEEKLDSPAIKQQEKKQAALEAAQTSFDNDPDFQKILNTFHATIVPNSIKHSN